VIIAPFEFAAASLSQEINRVITGYGNRLIEENVSVLPANIFTDKPKSMTSVRIDFYDEALNDTVASSVEYGPVSTARAWFQLKQLFTCALQVST
jgi:hypothetical protein